MPYKDPEARRAYQREWQSNRKAAWFADKSCVVCGSTENLELHHIDPTQKVSHRIWTWAPARRDAELAKCEVRCHDHHVALRPAAPHGSIGRYNKGCKCEPCKVANAARVRNQRALRATRTLTTPI